MGQLSLSFRSSREDLTLDERFREFHQAHPDVYRLFARFANEIRATGRERYGAKSLIERIRWHIDTSSRGEPFKLDNSLTSRYVRLLISDDPSFNGFFEQRTLKS